MTKKTILLLIKLSRPFFLLGSASQYLLGVGMARYLGATLDGYLIILGLVWVWTIQLTTHFLNEYYDQHIDNDVPNRTPFSGGSGVLGDGEDQLNPEIGKLAAGAALTLVAFVTIAILQAGGISASVALVMVLIFLGSFFYATPPVRLLGTGYGELTTAIILGNLVPALGFLLLMEPLHRLFIITTLPLTFLALSLLISVELPDYATDLKHEKRNLLVRLGWQNGMLLHNLFILIAFVLIGLAGLFGLPPAIALPAFLPLPLALLQIWHMRGIAQGAKPNWLTLSFNGVVVFGAVSYLLTFAFWIR